MTYSLSYSPANLALASSPLQAIGGVAGLLSAFPQQAVDCQIHVLDLVTPVLHLEGAPEEETMAMAKARSSLRCTGGKGKDKDLEALTRIYSHHERLQVLDEGRDSYREAAQTLVRLYQGKQTPDIDATWAPDPEEWQALSRASRDYLRNHYQHFEMISLLSVSPAYHARALSERLANNFSSLTLLDDEDFLKGEDYEELVAEIMTPMSITISILTMITSQQETSPRLASSFRRHLKKKTPTVFRGRLQHVENNLAPLLIAGLERWNDFLPADSEARITPQTLTSLTTFLSAET